MFGPALGEPELGLKAIHVYVLAIHKMQGFPHSEVQLYM